MTSARITRPRGLCGRGWSLAAFALCAAAEAATLAVIFGPGQDSDVRWTLVLLPFLIAALPVLLPSRRARIGAAVIMAGWCVVASASVGLFFVPALVAMVVAAARSET